MSLYKAMVVSFWAVGIIVGYNLGVIWSCISHEAAVVMALVLSVGSAPVIFEGARSMAVLRTESPAGVVVSIYFGLAFGMLIGLIPSVFPGTFLTAAIIVAGLSLLVPAFMKVRELTGTIACFLNCCTRHRS